ncbi:MAG TPA: PAS domain S-box protein [Thermoanaerobaculia bacterium]|jgi:PAS domain S-box-containing protein|nr:PAS domain S-box protein [Thermoanaerobaculia bacterium]
MLNEESLGAALAPADLPVRPQADPELESAEWHRLILNNTSDVISIHTPDGVYVFVCGACRRVLGYEPEEMAGRSFFDFVHPEDREHVLESHRLLLDGVESLNVTYRLRCREDRYIWAEVSFRALAGGPEPGCCVAVTRDVTVHKEAEDQQARLRRALERAAFEWRTTFDAIETPILLLGLDGRVRKVNRAAKELLGSEYREIIGRPVNEIGHGPPWGAVAALAGGVLESSSPQVCEATDEKRARTWEVEAIASAMREEEVEEAKVIVQVRDITKTARLQESLRRSETMAALGAVVGGVAHEVRNPLFGMSAVLDAFESRFGGRPEHQPYLPLLRAELDRMNALMQALLDYGKPARFEMTPGDLARPLERALELCRPLAERQGVTLALPRMPRMPEGAAPPPVLHDADRLAQAFKNVIENAVQHSPRGSEVRLEWREVASEEASWVRLSVRDRGPGFAPADLPRVTDPFFSRRQGGTGLGLSIVSRVVEGHGGNLQVTNHPEGGAVVEIDLPCIRSTEVR